MKAVSASPIVFKALFNEINNDKTLSLPSFQRRYTWSVKDGNDFLDSIYKGYPVGTIYIWASTKDELAKKNFAYSSDLEAKNASRYLIDGQQRLTTLCKLYSQKDDYDLYFNPTKETFEPHNKKDVYKFNEDNKFKNLTNKRLSVKELWHLDDDFEKLDKIFENQKKTRLVGKNSTYFSDEEIKAIKKLKEKLTAFTFSVSEISEATAQEILHLYTRINTSGKKLHWVDSLATPLLLSIQPKLKKDISEFIDFQNKNLNGKANITGFESLLTEEFFLEGIIRIIEPKYATSVLKKNTSTTYSPQSIDAAFSILKNGTVKAISLLKNTLHVNTEKMIKKDFSFMILTIALGSLDNRNLTYDEERTLSQYFVLTNVFDFYSSSTSSQKKKADHLGKIKKANSTIFQVLQKINNELVKEIKKANSSNYYFTISELGQAKYSAGRESTAFIMLEYSLTLRNPTTFENFGEKVNFSSAHKHHIFPTAYLAKHTKHEIKDINSIGNITYINSKTNSKFSDKPPKDYFDSTQPSLELLEKHLFPEDFQDYKKLLIEDYKEFITKRENALFEEFNNYLQKLEQK